MSVADNGGPAFPLPGMTGLPNGQFIYGTEGMTLRDYFAAKAMPAVYQRVESGGFERVAKLSYEMADAMLAARV